MDIKDIDTSIYTKISKLSYIIRKRRNLFRIVCVLFSFFVTVYFILHIIYGGTDWISNIFVGAILSGALVVYFICSIEMMLLRIECFIDKILIFDFITSILFFGASVVSSIAELLFNNIKINIYFGVITFFVTGYLLDIFYRKEYDSAYLRNSFSDEKDLDIHDGDKAVLDSIVFVSFLCNILQILLIVVVVFDSLYNFGVQEYPILEAILTSLAVEKLLKLKFNKLGEYVDY